jgi:surfeit locus 1 family protein
MSSARRFPLGLTLAVAIALALLCGLGTWQLKRLAWKEALLARIAALQGAAPQPAGAVLDRLGQGQDVDYTRVILDCPGLAAAPFLEFYAVREGQAGVRLISACPVEAGRYGSVLVDRGFVGDTVSARPPVAANDRTPLTLTGVLHRPDKPTFVTPPNEPAANRWYSRDLPAMARALGASAPAPLMVMAESATNPGWKALVPAPLPVEIPNRHLEYALTWFGLAGALLAVYAAMLWRRWKA